MKYLIAIIFLFNIVILNLKNFYHENLAKLALFINKNKYYLIIYSVSIVDFFIRLLFSSKYL